MTSELRPGPDATPARDTTASVRTQFSAAAGSAPAMQRLIAFTGRS